MDLLTFAAVTLELRSTERATTAVPKCFVGRLVSPPVVPESLRSKDINKVLGKLTGILKVSEREALYWILLSYWMDPSSVTLGATEPLTHLTDKTKWAQIDDIMHVMMYLDTIMYLPDDILVKVDRASMGVSLESRVPLLDHRIIEFAWTLPIEMKVKGAVGKFPLRNLLYRYVPKRLVDRPKKGFGVPIHEWLRGRQRAFYAGLPAHERELAPDLLIRLAGLIDELAAGPA